MIDDKLRLLTVVKKVCRDRVTTVFPRQGHYAHDPEVVSACPAADATVAHVGELLTRDLPARPGASNNRAARTMSTNRSVEHG